MPKDLRYFLTRLEQNAPDELVRVGREARERQGGGEGQKIAARRGAGHARWLLGAMMPEA